MKKLSVNRFMIAAAAFIALGVASSANAVTVDYFKLDIGPDNHDIESGFVSFTNAQSGSNNNNGPEVIGAGFTSLTGDALTISLNDTNAAGNDEGRIDWRDRGSGPAQPLVDIAEDFVKNNSGIIRVTISGMSAGTYEGTSWHVDPSFTQSGQIEVNVDVDGGGFLLSGTPGNANINNGGPGGLTTADIMASEATFSFMANGIDDVILIWDGNPAGDDETPLNGFELRKVSTIPEPTTATLGLIGMAGLLARRRRAA